MNSVTRTFLSKISKKKFFFITKQYLRELRYFSFIKIQFEPYTAQIIPVILQ